MDILVDLIGAREAVIEINDGGKYESDYEYTVTVNGEEYIKTKRTVVSLYGLNPDSDVSVYVEGNGDKKEISFHTKYESVRFDVRDFGAIGDGMHDDTNAIQCAIMACPKDGRVVIGDGVFNIYPLFLKSDITLEISKTGVLSAFTDRESFPILPGNVNYTNEDKELFLGTWEGDPRLMFAGILTGIEVKNLLITGEGEINGNASVDNWWNNPKEIRIATRPRMIFLDRSENVRVQGITVKNSPSWNIHPYFCKHVGFYDLKVKGPKVSPNTDGCNPESCDDVDIVGVHFSVGDDCIAIKSGKIYMGAKYKTPSTNLNIRKCCMRDGHGAIVIGSEMAGGVTNINVTDCIFLNTDRGLRIKTRRGRGKDAIVDNVKFENITMDNVMTPVVINSFYFCDSDGHSEYVQTKEALPVDERTPRLGSFIFKDIKATNCHVAASYMYGLPEQKIESVTFDNVDISFADKKTPGVPAMMDGVGEMTGVGFFAKNVENLQFNNCHITGQETEEKIID